MLLLPDDLPRKQIAARLAISKETISDHLRSIYAHFGVTSAMELASHFLRDL